MMAGFDKIKSCHFLASYIYHSSALISLFNVQCSMFNDWSTIVDHILDTEYFILGK